MPVNDFEKQVQQKMDELQLRPSAEVWEEVEKRIRKEKKRRWFTLWAFIFGALLLGGTCWWLTIDNKKELPVNNTTVQTATEKKNDDIAANPKKETVAEKKIDSNDNIKSQTVEEPQSTNSLTTTKTDVIQNKRKPVTEQIRKLMRGEKRIENPVTVLLEKEKAEEDRTSLQDISTVDKPVADHKEDSAGSLIKADKIVITDINTTTRDSLRIDKNIVAKNDPVSIKQEIISEVKDSLIEKQTETVSKKDSVKPKNNNWEFGITGMVGTSGKSDGISIFGGQKSLDAFSQNNSAGAGGQSAAITAAQPGNGFAWQMGVYAKRKLSVRTGFSIGLNFSAYSTKQLTGVFVDSLRTYTNNLYSSSVREFYRAGTGTTYKNHYYYLQLPISFHWQINKGAKLPLIFHNGLSAGFFTGSDALVYNSGSNVFYRDNKSFNKIQVSYQSGLYAKLFNRSKNPLTAGVLFNYHFSKLQKVNINGGNHLTSFGIQLGWVLKK